MLKPAALALLAVSMLAQTSTPTLSDPTKELATLKEENANLKKLLSAYDHEYNACHAAVLQLQVLGTPKPIGLPQRTAETKAAEAAMKSESAK